MNCRTMFFICFLLIFILPSANCHSVSRRKASPFFHILFPNRRRSRKPKKIRLLKPPLEHHASFEIQLGNNYNFKQPPTYPPPPLKKPEHFHLGNTFPDVPYQGPIHIPQNNNNLDYNFPHGEGQIYEELSNHISPHSPHPPGSSPLGHKIPNQPPLTQPPHFGSFQPHSSSYPSHSGPHPPHPSPDETSSNKKNNVRFRIIKTPPISLNEIVRKPKPVKFPKKPKNKNKKSMFDLRGQKGRKKSISDIVKETIYYGEYPKKNIVINKERVQPVLLPAGVKGLDPNTLDFIREKLKEYTINRSR